jgi:calcineurin-like phosphoesterase family protein
MATFLISDTHFGHENIIGYSQRPFHTVYDMDETMVHNWNVVVQNQDKVYHLGDVYMGKDRERIDSLLGRLKGTKVLILGNHDNGRDQLLIKHFKRIYSYRHLPEYGVLLSHIPVHATSLGARFPVNIHGHTHTNGSPDGPYKSACVELIHYTPKRIESFK